MREDSNTTSACQEISTGCVDKAAGTQDENGRLYAALADLFSAIVCYRTDEQLRAAFGNGRLLAAIFNARRALNLAQDGGKRK